MAWALTFVTKSLFPQVIQGFARLSEPPLQKFFEFPEKKIGDARRVEEMTSIHMDSSLPRETNLTRLAASYITPPREAVPKRFNPNLL